MANSRIVGLGRHLPDNVVTNEDLTRVMETSEEWIQQRTGIRERRYVDGDIGAADLGAIAAREALERAGLRADEMDLVLFATLTPDYDFPASACSNTGAPNITAVNSRSPTTAVRKNGSPTS